MKKITFLVMLAWASLVLRAENDSLMVQFDFLSTHDVELSLQLADCIWLMEPDRLNVGTPHQLAETGALSRFIEHDGITFDRATLTIHVTK